MKLDAGTISYILSVVKTARLVGIDNVIIEPDLVRAIDDSSSVVLYQNENVQAMPFGSIGLNRISELLARHDIAMTQDSFSMEAVLDDESEWARSLTMKAKGMKIDYRCANPATIKAPRQINDTLKVKVAFSGNAVALMQKGQVAMGAENITLISNDEGVSFEFVDVNSDVFKHTFATSATALQDGGGTKFAHRYPAKTLLAIFKELGEGTFEIGQKGILRIAINGLMIFVLPKV